MRTLAHAPTPVLQYQKQDHSRASPHTDMDVLYKGTSLLFTQITTAAHIALLLPRYVIANATQQTPDSTHPGATYYEGKVIHSRRQPVQNSFEYPVRMVLVDLQQPPPWFQQQQASDHLNLQAARDFAMTDGKVLLLTNPVVGGYVQNPISVYYCFDAAGKLAKCIAEVTNTPWGERVSFVFNPAGDTSPKALHVSPFMDMDNTWQLTASEVGPKVSVSVRVTHPTLGAYFDAHLLLKECSPEQQGPAELTGLSSLWRYGFMPQRVAFWIYWQAVKLIAKGCPIYRKPSSDFQQRVAGSTSIQNSGAGCPYVWREAQQWPWYL